MFKASALEFRSRYLHHTLIFALGSWAPWNFLLHLDPPGPNAHVWGILSANLAQAGWMRIDAAFELLLSLAIAFAVGGAVLRTWGGAYLGANIVQAPAMHIAASAAPGILTDGPFRHMRNPLYCGTFLHTFALALLMPRTGAIFAIVAIALVQVRLILGEEDFLRRSIGAPYAAYCALVPRLWPSLRGKVAPAGRQPRWGQALLGELYFWTVALSFAFAGWRYNAGLLFQCVLVGFGFSLVVKALIPRAPVTQA